MIDHKQDERERFQAALFGEEERKLIELARSTLTEQDRTELAQYRAIFGALSTLLTDGGSLHLYSAQDGRTGARVVKLDGQEGETVEAVTGATLRDCLAQAAQVVA